LTTKTEQDARKDGDESATSGKLLSIVAYTPCDAIANAVVRKGKSSHSQRSRRRMEMPPQVQRIMRLVVVGYSSHSSET
jgi:hypothetical protein